MPVYNSLVGVEWNNGNQLRNYPLADDATRLDNSGSFTLPNDLLTDISFPAPGGSYEPSKFHLFGISVHGAGVVVTIAYDGTLIATASIPSDAADVSSHFLVGTGNFNDSVGVLTIGKLSTTMLQAGVYAFSLAAGRLVPTAIRPDLHGIRRLVVAQGTDSSVPLTGDIALEAGNNIAISTTSGQVTISAFTTGSGDTTDCGCDDLTDLPPPIRRINGVAPATNGNFTLVAGSCVELTSISNGLKISTPCVTPCCTDTELSALAVDQAQLAYEIRSMIRRLDQLAGSIVQLRELKQTIEADGVTVGLHEEGWSSNP